MLTHGESVRCLGVQVGTGETIDANWSDRARKIKARLHTAGAALTGIPSRVLIVNAVILPAVVYTARFTKLSLKWLCDIERMQKVFL